MTLGTLLPPKQVRAVFRSGPCQLGSVCVWQEAPAGFGFLPWQIVTFTYPHVIRNTHTHPVQSHLPIFGAVEWCTGEDFHQDWRRIRENEEKIKWRRKKINLKLYTLRVNKARAAPRPCMYPFTFNSPSPKGVIYISFFFFGGETSGNETESPHNYSLIHIHKTLRILFNPLELRSNYI